MNDELLIECVRKRAYLYDPRDKSHADQKRRNKAWEEISSKLGRPVSECKRRWASLRDQYRKSVVRKIRPVGGQGIPYPQWRYEEIMSFLLPSMTEWPGRQAQEFDGFGEDQLPLKEEDDPMKAEELVVSPDCTPGTSCSPSPSPSFAFGSRLEPQVHAQIHEPFACYVAREERRSDALGKFFEAMEESVRSLKPVLQIEAKGRIASIVTELEMRSYLQDQRRLTSGDDETADGLSSGKLVQDPAGT